MFAIMAIITGVQNTTKYVGIMGIHFLLTN
jgi:hypothetical protein